MKLTLKNANAIIISIYEEVDRRLENEEWDGSQVPLFTREFDRVSVGSNILMVDDENLYEKFKDLASINFFCRNGDISQDSAISWKSLKSTNYPRK